MIKRFLTITATTLAITVASPAQAWWWDNYGSKYEAQKACSTWSFEGPKYTVEIEYPSSIRALYTKDLDFKTEYKVGTQTARRCTYEMVTRQFLGEQNMCVKDGDVFKRDTKPEVCYAIKRRFKY